MSLKAKFEAIIYAAEEPVTLVQLASLFAGELRQQAEVPTEAAPEIAAEGESQATEVSAGSDAVGSSAADSDAANASAKAAPDSAAIRAEQRQLRDAAKAVVNQLIADYAAVGESERGMEIREVAGGYRMATKPEFHDAVRGFIKSLKPPLKLSLPALETLAVIAYKQPVTAPEISEIRGVDSAGVLGGLLTRKLITTAGRKQVLGRPILYKTTQEFLMRFGLKDVAELPSLEEFEKMAAEVAEFDDSQATSQQAAQEQAALAQAESDEPIEEAETTDREPEASEPDSMAIEVEDEQARP